MVFSIFLQAFAALDSRPRARGATMMASFARGCRRHSHAALIVSLVAIRGARAAREHVEQAGGALGNATLNPGARKTRWRVRSRMFRTATILDRALHRQRDALCY